MHSMLLFFVCFLVLFTEVAEVIFVLLFALVLCPSVGRWNKDG